MKETILAFLWPVIIIFVIGYGLSRLEDEMGQKLCTNNYRQNIQTVKESIQNYYKDRPNTQVIQDLTLAQAILEAGLRSDRPSSLALKYNNLFGIKGEGSGMELEGIFKNTVLLPTHEYYNGRMHEVDQKFAVNGDLESSIEQHDKLLHRPRYQKVIEAQTFDEAAQRIYEAGYAADNKYPQKLISIYRAYIK